MHRGRWLGTLGSPKLGSRKVPIVKDTARPELQLRALALLRDYYQTAFLLSRVDLNEFNHARPPSRRYQSIADLVKEGLAAAGAVASFAVELGLVTPDQARQALLDLLAEHPELSIR
jgi:hypothetical protein